MVGAQAAGVGLCAVVGEDAQVGDNVTVCY